MKALLLLLALAAPRPAAAQEDYGAKGIYPVYEAGGQWVVFDKKASRKATPQLAVGKRMLLVGSSGAQVFEIARASATYGAVCRARKPARTRAALLRGPRGAVGRPIIAIAVPDAFSLKGSKAVYKALKNAVDDAAYQRLLEPLKTATIEDVKSGAYRFKLDDGAAEPFIQNPNPNQIQIKLDFGSPANIKGLHDPFVFVEESQISASNRRCVRLADGAKLVGGCAEMPRALMADTDLLEFVSYDPSGGGTPLVLAFTKETPMWGDERWGYVARASGAKLFLMDAMDIRCRESF